jgi:septal ring factor EnvC (AmiA/AmiB activator)
MSGYEIGLWIACVLMAAFGWIESRFWWNKVRKMELECQQLKDARKDAADMESALHQSQAKCRSLQSDLDAANREIDTLRGIHAVDTAYLTQD